MKGLVKSILNVEGEVLTLRKFDSYQDAITGDWISSGQADIYPTGYIEEQTEEDRLDLFGLHIPGDAFAILLPDAYASGGDWLIHASGTVDERIYNVDEVQRKRSEGTDVYDLLVLKKRS